MDQFTIQRKRFRESVGVGLNILQWSELKSGCSVRPLSSGGRSDTSFLYLNLFPFRPASSRWCALCIPDAHFFLSALPQTVASAKIEKKRDVLVFRLEMWERLTSFNESLYFRIRSLLTGWLWSAFFYTFWNHFRFSSVSTDGIESNLALHFKSDNPRRMQIIWNRRGVSCAL